MTKPDWRDPCDYPDLENTSKRCWAWQFLRRNPAYRANYERYAALPEEIKAGSSDYDHPETPTDWFAFKPPALPGERFEDYSKRVGGKYCVRPLEIELCEKYGLYYLPDPDCAAPPRLIFDTNWVRYAPFVPGGPNFSLKPKTANELAVMFDLAWPIEGQLKRAKRLLERRRRHLEQGGLVVIEKRHRADKFQVYLRLLDAEASGASTKDMAAKLFPDKSNSYSDGYLGDKTVRYGLDSARRIRDHDYIYLPL